jgi:hypothetical protein
MGRPPTALAPPLRKSKIPADEPVQMGQCRWVSAYVGHRPMRNRLGRPNALLLEAMGTGRMLESGARTTVVKLQPAADLRTTR